MELRHLRYFRGRGRGGQPHDRYLADSQTVPVAPRRTGGAAPVALTFDMLFNKRDFVGAKRFWSDRYIQHSAHIAPGREGLFDLIRSLPETLRYENQLIVAEGDYVIAHGRFSGHGRPAAWIAADVIRFVDGKLAAHWDVLQDEATRAVGHRVTDVRRSFSCLMRSTGDFRSGNAGNSATPCVDATKDIAIARLSTS